MIHFAIAVYFSNSSMTIVHLFSPNNWCFWIAVEADKFNFSTDLNSRFIWLNMRRKNEGIWNEAMRFKSTELGAKFVVVHVNSGEQVRS